MHPDVMEIFEEFQVNAQLREIQVNCIGFNDKISETPMEDFEEQVLNKPRAKTSKVAKLFNGK